MKQLFNKDTIESRFIKYILQNTPLPLFNSVSEGDYVISGQKYIYRKQLVKCTKTGYIEGESPLTKALYVPLEHIDFNTNYPGYNMRYFSPYGYYDLMTHRKLGDYLRYYRDYYGVDLMPFYNCALPDFISTFYLTYTNNQINVINKKSTNFKIYKIPIKFNRDYSVYIDSDFPVLLNPMLLDSNNSEIKLTLNNTPDVDMSDTLSIRYSRMNYSSFKKPFVINVSTIGNQYEDILYTLESDLYLILQVPNTNNSSLVVLEGDYLALTAEKIINVSNIENLFPSQMNKLYLSDLSLVQFNDEQIYPFADRLVEYLFDNVITSEDTLEYDLDRVQNVLSQYGPSGFVKQIWNNYLRYYIYKYQRLNKKLRHLDLNGFVDKDTEYNFDKNIFVQMN